MLACNDVVFRAMTASSKTLLILGSGTCGTASGASTVSGTGLGTGLGNCSCSGATLTTGTAGESSTVKGEPHKSAI